MSVNWCANCGGSHAAGRICTEEVPATGPERHGWRHYLMHPCRPHGHHDRTDPNAVPYGALLWVFMPFS